MNCHKLNPERATNVLPRNLALLGRFGALLVAKATLTLKVPSYALAGLHFAVLGLVVNG